MNKTMNTNLINKYNSVKLNPCVFPMADLSLGHDCELFIEEVKSGTIVNAIPVCAPHNKDNPIDLGNGVTGYNDNMLYEFTLKPYKTKQEMVTIFHDAFSRIKKHLGKDYRLVAKAAHEFPQAEIDKDPKSLEIGCLSSYNCWDVCVNDPKPFDNGWRSSGMHIHLGAKDLVNSFENRINLICALDICLGVPSVIFENDKTEIYRRQRYGTAGDHRNPKHGSEYRVLSSAVLNSKENMELTYDLVDYALSFVKTNTVQSLIDKIDKTEVRRAINEYDADLSSKIIKQIGMPDNLVKRIYKKQNKDLYSSWKL